MTTGDLLIGTADFSSKPNPLNEPICQALLRQSATSSTTDSKRADVLVYSVFGLRHLTTRGTTIAFSNEPRFQTEGADYTVDCRFLPLDTHLRLPYWAYLLLKTGEHTAPPMRPPAERFCAFVYHNQLSPLRNAFFEMLNERQPVDALGRVMNNRTDPRLVERHAKGTVASKREVLADYRFTIAFENTEIPGYTTEKIIDAWLAGSVPIYWGNPAFTREFPSAGCLNLYTAGSMERLVEQVLEAERNPDRYAELQAANPFRTGHAQEMLARYRHNLDAFAERVVTDVRNRPTTRMSRPARLRRSVRVRVLRAIQRLTKKPVATMWN